MSILNDWTCVLTFTNQFWPFDGFKPEINSRYPHPHPFHSCSKRIGPYFNRQDFLKKIFFFILNSFVLFEIFMKQLFMIFRWEGLNQKSSQRWMDERAKIAPKMFVPTSKARSYTKSRYNREGLSPISRIDFQWRAQVSKGKKLQKWATFDLCFFHFLLCCVRTKKLHYMKVRKKIGGIGSK